MGYPEDAGLEERKMNEDETLSDEELLDKYPLANKPQVCAHGRLKRHCLICELQEELARVEREYATARRLLGRLGWDLTADGWKKVAEEGKTI